MFAPTYTITDQLLANIKRINKLVSELNYRRFPNVVLFEMERTAREVSSYASNSIEGNPLPLTEVKKILKSTPTNIQQSEKEILNYNRALEYLAKTLKKKKVGLSVDLILQIHKLVMKDLLLESEVGGIRQNPVVVNNPRTGGVVYLPPDVNQVKLLITELVDFVNDNHDRIDNLILAGIFHKQMVLIHPFINENGRTARLATKVLLTQMGLNTFNLFSFENYYNQNVSRYFEKVGERGDYYELAKKIDFTPWLEYFSGGIIDELLRVQKLLPRMAVTPKSEIKDYHQKVLKFISVKGFIRDSDYAKLVGRARPTRALDLQKLIDLGLIERKGKGKATYYQLKV